MQQSLIGATLDGPKIGSMKASAFLAMDFFGGGPQLSYAYARLDGERSGFEVGQDDMILAPNNPTSLGTKASPLFYGSGNLFSRRPQIRAERVLATGDFGEIRAVGGIVALADSFFVGAVRTGGRMPGLQARLSWRALPERPNGKPKWELGASGHYSREGNVPAFVGAVGAPDMPSWAAAFDFNATRGRFGTGGEIFLGRNIDAFRGSVGQGAKSWGGFLEARLAATQRLSFNGGYGTDRLFDLARFPATFSGDSSAFGNTIYQFTPEFSSSIEYRWLGTKLFATEVRRDHELRLVFAYSF